MKFKPGDRVVRNPRSTYYKEARATLIRKPDPLRYDWEVELDDPSKYINDMILRNKMGYSGPIHWHEDLMIPEEIYESSLYQALKEE